MKLIYENDEFIFVEPKEKNIRFIALRIIGNIASKYYKFRIINNKSIHQDKKYFFSICAIFKNESFYLKEWIEFHLKVGVDHFYLYNNFSDDNYLDVLQPYIERKIVDLIDWPVPQGQLTAYKDCVERNSNNSQWIAFIDLDEFLTPLAENNVVDILQRFIDRPVVKVYWKIFGSSGLDDRNVDSSVVQDFIYAWPKIMNFGKCIFNTDYTFDSTLKQNNAFHHHMWVKVNNTILPPVNLIDEVSLGVHDSLNRKTIPIQLNHYIIKSRSEFIRKKSRGDVFYKLSPVNEDYFNKYEKLATVIDKSAIDFLDRRDP